VPGVCFGVWGKYGRIGLQLGTKSATKSMRLKYEPTSEPLHIWWGGGHQFDFVGDFDVRADLVEDENVS